MRKFIIVLILLHGIRMYSFSQNVGIGTILPAEKLHVAGNIKADTIKPNGIKLTPNAGAGKVLTSDAAGNAIWEFTNAAAAGNLGFGVWGDCATNGNISEYNPVTDSSGSASDRFGGSVSISGNYAIVGAYFDDINGNSNQGSASIYEYNGTNWVFMQKITDASGAANDVFGMTVAISGNFAIVGAYSDDIGLNADQGSASIFQYNGSSWVLMQKITDAAGIAGDKFGFSVSIAGIYAIIGASGDDVNGIIDQGSASIYRFNGVNSWGLMQKIIDPGGLANDFFGESVGISGSYAIVGVPNDDVGVNTDLGSACIYHTNGFTWTLMQKITDATGTASDAFGNSVSISGNYAIAGAYDDDLNGNANQGSASMFQYNGSSWVLMQKFSDAGGGVGDNFGIKVIVSGNFAIIGESFHDVGLNADQGSATIYVKMGMGWQKLQYVLDPAGNGGDAFGIGVAIDGNTKRFLIGVYGYAGLSGKAVFGKLN